MIEKVLQEPVTVVVSRRVKKGKETEFETISSKMTEVASGYEGHLGAVMFKPANPDDPEYRVIFKFDTPDNYQNWETSEQRARFLESMEPLLEEPPATEIMSGVVTWFVLPGNNPVQPPPKYKMAIVSWLAVFPTVTLIFVLLGEQLAPLPLFLRVFIVTVLVIFLMTYVLMPNFTSWFAFWLFPKTNKNIR